MVSEHAHPWVTARDGGVRWGVLIGWQPHVQPWPALLRHVREAEADGFDAVFLPDHPTQFPECWTHLAALAVSTSKIRLGTLVCGAPFRHPLLLARVAADVDRLSGGRAILGLGAGDREEELADLGHGGLTRADLMASLKEVAAIVRPLLSHEGCRFQGARYSVDVLALAPGPVQRPGVPIVIAGGGEKVTLPLVARYADACNFGGHAHTGSAWEPADAARKYGVLEAACARLGRDPATVLRTLWTPPVLLAATPAEAQAKVGLLTPGQRAFYGSAVFAGTPDQLAERWHGWVEAGVEYFVVNAAGDDETLALFASSVGPELRRRGSANGSGIRSKP